jgi:hypothetical protein
MFEIGTEVAIVESEPEGNKALRRGSLGFVSSVSNDRALKQDMVVVSSMSIDFFRFGFEERHRSEFKTVISIMPMLVPGNVKGQLDSFINNLKAGKLEKVKKNIKALMDNEDLVGSTICVVAPAISGIDLRSCDKNVLFSWIDAHCRNREFMKLISSLIVSNHYRNSRLSKETSNHTLSNIFESMDRSTRIRLVDFMMHSSDKRQELLNVIQTIKAIGYRGRASGLVSEIHDRVYGDGGFAEMHAIMMKYVYRPIVMSAYRDVEKSRDNNIGHINLIEEGLCEILGLSSRLCGKK